MPRVYSGALPQRRIGVRRVVRRLTGQGTYVPRGSVRGFGAYRGRRRVLRGRGAYGTAVGRRRLRGRGAFWDDIWSGVKTLAGDVYDVARKPLKSKLGAMLSGLGDYSVKKNSILDEGQDPPLLANSARYNIIRHREYLGDVTTAGAAFTINSYPINPGMIQTFPWFASIAQNYMKYKPRGIVFEYKSMSAEALNSTNTALGAVVMATQYNVLQPAFTNQSQLLNYDKSTAGAPSKSMMHPVECDPTCLPYKEFYVRHGALSANQDLRLYDMGTFYIATYGQQAAATIGQLWVTFEFELVTPAMEGGAGETLLSDCWYSTTGITTSKYFGSTVLPDIQNSLGLTLGATSITFPAYIVQGKYLLTYWLQCTSGALTMPLITAASATTASVGGQDVAPTGGETVTRGMASIVITIVGPSAVINFSVGTFPTIAAMRLRVTQYDADNNSGITGTAVTI